MGAIDFQRRAAAQQARANRANPFRDVVSHAYVGACRYTGYIARSIRLTLECGHTMTRKASQGVPRKARCYDCGKA
jgi:hypothetical protein